MLPDISRSFLLYIERERKRDRETERETERDREFFIRTSLIPFVSNNTFILFKGKKRGSRRSCIVSAILFTKLIFWKMDPACHNFISGFQ